MTVDTIFSFRFFDFQLMMNFGIEACLPAGSYIYCPGKIRSWPVDKYVPETWKLSGTHCASSMRLFFTCGFPATKTLRFLPQPVFQYSQSMIHNAVFYHFNWKFSFDCMTNTSQVESRLIRASSKVNHCSQGSVGCLEDSTNGSVLFGWTYVLDLGEKENQDYPAGLSERSAPLRSLLLVALWMYMFTHHLPFLFFGFFFADFLF